MAIVAVLLTGSVPAASSSTQAQYDRVQAQLSQTRALIAKTQARERELKRAIAATSSRRQSLQAEIDQLSGELATVQRELDSVQSELAVVNQRLHAKTEELERMLARLQEANDVMRKRTVQVYKSGLASWIDFLLGANTFSDLMTRVHVLSGVFAGDQARIRSIQQQREQIEAEVRDIEALKALAGEQVLLVSAKRNHVASLKGVIDARRRELDRTLANQRANLQDVQETKEQYLRRQAELERESQRIGALLSGISGGTASAKRGEMVWPTSGPVTSPYGYRTHPIYGDRRFHDGIDIGAPHGQTVVASASGRVVHAGPKGGYGNTVILDHGGGLASVYAHLSSIGVSEGASVTQSRSIGRVGCTGSCTGPHLHFEVRVNGKTQNPMGWLP